MSFQHGVPRGTGEKPTTDHDRRRELQKIIDYKGLVESVASRVSVLLFLSPHPNRWIDPPTPIQHRVARADVKAAKMESRVLHDMEPSQADHATPSFHGSCEGCWHCRRS